MSSNDVPSSLSHEHASLLLEIARSAIRHGLEYRSPPAVDLRPLPPAFGELRATFVTLELRRQLRGCIGSLEAHRPLAEDVACNAFAAAFRDPRFPPVSRTEVALLELHVSLLSIPEPLPFESEADLLDRIIPGVDGLILADGARRGTFLPSVWESLPETRQFWEHLKLKAGLPRNHWSATLRVWRYRTEVIESG